MARYRPVWLEVALEQYSNLPADVQALIDARIDALLDNPSPADAGYDASTDQWTTIFGSGVGVDDTGSWTLAYWTLA